MEVFLTKNELLQCFPLKSSSITSLLIDQKHTVMVSQSEISFIIMLILKDVIQSIYFLTGMFSEGVVLHGGSPCLLLQGATRSPGWTSGWMKAQTFPSWRRDLLLPLTSCRTSGWWEQTLRTSRGEAAKTTFHPHC